MVNTYKITITEISKATVEVEAETREEALATIERDYWKNPNDYVLEPEDTTFE